MQQMPVVTIQQQVTQVITAVDTSRRQLVQAGANATIDCTATPSLHAANSK